MRNALVFGGGGGKGAYEAGVWKALRELGVEPRFSCVVGTSVGALNAVLFAQRSLEQAEHIWSTLTPGAILTDNCGSSGALASHDGLRQLLMRYVTLRPSDLSVYVCCSRILHHDPDAARLFDVDLAEQYQTEYFRLNDLTRWEQVHYLLASAALPFAFEHVEINGARYRDGGILPEHNLPYGKAAELGCTRVLAVSLDTGVTREISCGNARVLILHPSTSLGDTISGTLDFNAESAGWRMRLGYQDTMSRRRVVEDFFGGSAASQGAALNQSQQERLRRMFRSSF